MQECYEDFLTEERVKERFVTLGQAAGMTKKKVLMKIQEDKARNPVCQ